MNIVSAVANLEKERDYYRDAIKECQIIIKQLIEGPGEIEYIHPWDVAEMFYAEPFVDIYKTNVPTSDIIEIAKTGKKYKQSIWIPAKTKNIK